MSNAAAMGPMSKAKSLQNRGAKSLQTREAKRLE
jgi:hypothetical protein